MSSRFLSKSGTKRSSSLVPLASGAAGPGRAPAGSGAAPPSIVPAMIDEVGRADLVLSRKSSSQMSRRDRPLEELAGRTRETRRRWRARGTVAVGLAQVHGRLAEAEGLAQGRRDDVHDRVELEARLQLVGELDEAAQQLDLATLGLAILLVTRNAIRLPRSSTGSIDASALSPVYPPRSAAAAYSAPAALRLPERRRLGAAGCRSAPPRPLATSPGTAA